MNEEINFCAECGAQVGSGDRFCPECGAALAVPAVPGARGAPVAAPGPAPAPPVPAVPVAPESAADGSLAAGPPPAPDAGHTRKPKGKPRRKRHWMAWTALAVVVVVGAIAGASALGLLPPIDWIPDLTKMAPTTQSHRASAPPPAIVEPAPKSAPQQPPPSKTEAPVPDASQSFRIAEEYAEGSGGRPRDLGKAITWYTRAARQGHAHAAWVLGRLYGFYSATPGVPRDVDRALYWMKAAADKGHPEAEFAMGMFFSDPAQFGDKYAGQRDYTRAIHWLKLAAKADHRIAPSQLAVLYAQLARYYDDRARLEPSLRERAASHAREAQFWLEEAARRGDKRAQQELLRQGNTW